MNRFKRYFDSVAFLEGLSNMPIQGNYMKKSRNPAMYLDRMRYFLHLLGDPDKGMRFIHVTGTAGKGTVTNMTHEIIYASGKIVGSFTSPFVTTSIEKIKVGEKYISPDEFAAIVELLKPFIDHAYIQGPYGRPSYFEIFLAIALIYFRGKKCQWVILEVGLGGRYDATNVIGNPIVTAITNIDYDHMEVLGDTLREIAFDKAGIIKKGSKFITTEQRPQLLNLFKNTCKKVGASYRHVYSRGDYQEDNKSLASQIGRNIGINERFIKQGIAKAKLQCRFETIQKHPLVILDGAHNRAKMRSTVNNLGKLNYKKLHLIIGMLENKNHDQILEQVIPLADAIYLTRFQAKDRKCAHPKDLLGRAKKYMRKDQIVRIILNPHRTLETALAGADKDDLVLVTGSFFLAGELRKNWVSEETILRKRKI